jgi:hypothetical protein
VYVWKRDKNDVIVGDVPDDRNNHAIKALCYGIVQLFGYSRHSARAKIKFY